MNSGGELGDTGRGCGTCRGAIGTGSGAGLRTGGAGCGDGDAAGSDRRGTARPGRLRPAGKRSRSGSVRATLSVTSAAVGVPRAGVARARDGAVVRRRAEAWGRSGRRVDMPRPLDAPIRLITSGAAPALARSRKARTTNSRKPRIVGSLATDRQSLMLSETAVGWHAAAASKTLRLRARSSLFVAAGGAKMFRPGSATAPVPKLSRGSSMTSAHDEPRPSKLAPGKRFGPRPWIPRTPSESSARTASCSS